VRVVYFDCFSGAAGDMILGALVDAGVPQEDVRSAVAALGLSGWSLDVRTVTKRGVRASKAVVGVSGWSGPRTFPELLEVIENSSLEQRVRRRAVAALRLLAESEARVHDVSVDAVHLHEAGAADALIDIAGSAAALEHFAPANVVVGPIATGVGSIETKHGILPAPAPAVTELLTGAMMYGKGDRELVTPTGAAILASAADEFGSLPPMRLTSVGYGAGDAELPHPNVLRVLVGDAAAEPDATEEAVLIETNIDDQSPELIPHVIDKLIAAGAHDAWVTPITMKKGRPAFILSALVSPDGRDDVAEVLFRQTSTLGVRTTGVNRHVLDREWFDVSVMGHAVRIKVGKLREEVVTFAPEYEDVMKIAEVTGAPPKDVYAEAVKAARSASDGENPT
jgi:pyridinium-3,5-bisthiocarboxylic acid mononucleotide nickel chelatase